MGNCPPFLCIGAVSSLLLLEIKPMDELCEMIGSVFDFLYEVSLWTDAARNPEYSLSIIAGIGLGILSRLAIPGPFGWVTLVFCIVAGLVVGILAERK